MKDFLSACAFYLAVGFVWVFALFCVYTVVIYAPVLLWTEAECYAKGYPEYRVDVTLGRYCMNLDGSVTVRVDKQ